MVYLGYLFMGLTCVRLLVSFCNWWSRCYLPKPKKYTSRGGVSVLIPARNEANAIGFLLEDLMGCKDTIQEILVYNDNSTDDTAKEVRAYMERCARIRLIEGDELPSGWLGKNHACHRLATEAHGDRLLFLDADVRVESDLIERAVSYMNELGLTLLSVFPKQEMTSWGTRISIPLMNLILLSLLPLSLVRLSPWTCFSAANGQFMLFDAATYLHYMPHKLFKHNRVEDIRILKFFKERRLKVATLLGDQSIRCLMYRDLDGAINGFTKNIFYFFGGSQYLTIFFVLYTTIAPGWIFMFNGLEMGMIYLVCLVLIQLFVSLASKQSVLYNVLLMPVKQIVLVSIVYKAIQNFRNKTLIWKDRNILQ